MRYLIVADIHGNLEALETVIADAQRGEGFGEIWCLGDMVGYGPDPGPCLALLRSFPLVAVAGNHDLAATGKIGLELFNRHAAEAARWTVSQLSREQISYLAGLPLQLEQGEFTLVHGSPLDPVWDYFLPDSMSHLEFRECFRRTRTPFCLVGQSHIPFFCRERDLAFLRLPEGQDVPLARAERAVINPGSVGQPRDGNPQASYGIYDAAKRVLIHARTPYDIAATQAKMRYFELPEPLIRRLSQGL
ncbi:MAG: metallophosphoesterase family protein [Chloroflexi bacterium]|nr:metallophosphoesterase family protein [Chloroflexota bacterium]